jgi:Protein of unknown function (DUF1566)
MKKQFTIFLITFLIAGLFVPQQIKAQSPPQKMSYQAVIRDANNVLIASTTVGMQISILQASAMGGSAPVYVETQTPTTNINGLVSLEVGTGTVISGTFSTIDWANGPFYIKTETDPAGGTTYTITGTSQLLSVPYAFYAKTSENGLTTGTSPGQMLYWNGTNWVFIAPGTNGQTLTNCYGVPTWGACTAPVIGDNSQGGIVFYILQSGDPGYVSGETHGLIAAPNDQTIGLGIPWSINNNPITTSSALGSGQVNTNAIITNQGAGTYAAKLCDDLVVGGYTDWYLPSKDELNLMNLKIGQSGNNFIYAYYWSSTESSDTNYAWLTLFTDNVGWSNDLKLNSNWVRAVRAF